MWILCIYVMHMEIIQIKNTYISSSPSTDDSLKLPILRFFFQVTVTAPSLEFSPDYVSIESALFFPLASQFGRCCRRQGGWGVQGEAAEAEKTWNECEIKLEHDEAGKRPWKQAPRRPARRWDEAGRAASLIGVRKCSQEARASSHTTPIISRPRRHPRVSIFRLLFKLREGLCGASVLTPLSWRLSALTVFNSLLEVRRLPCEESCERRAGAYIWEQSRSADTLQKAVGGEECFCWVYFVACNCL